ncbi:lasso peptide isopeptide bond-forming cyclase [Paenisporosarcina sp. TG-14]|uniref:lasso peptide isopeptide bond-forming cyclase n=1 Tax=Paenisporosarcina sp. TG-14 TaxID=1231057 RepID=UPI0003060E72|nr:lasso peptide isopeptide bond-forming cyclase [Paenisporosarcina sp. TG-14]
MSAITGIYQFNKDSVRLQHGRLLMKSLEKFPADSRQIWNDHKVFLGSHAQWITPESVQETLPFYDYERQMVITADAIIDNRQELFDLLPIEIVDRISLTDSQLILLSYQKWGEDCLKHLVGDFAFMIWDQRQQRLFGARDFSGSRTLYFHKNQETLAFCTLIEPLLALPYIEKKLNEQWLAEYLAISGMVDGVDSSITPYQNIEQLPPSHSISVMNNKVTLKRYSYITQGNRLKLKSDGEYVEAFQSVFQEAVTSRLRTHRKVGSQLSGGLDSGAVVGFAAKNLQSEKKLLHTFSYIPPDDFKDYTPKYLVADERPFIKSTVEYVGGISDHYHDFEGKDSLSEIDDFLKIMEMPYKFFENSFWLKGMFEKAHEKDIGILLNGDRGNFTISWGDAFDYYSTLLKKLKWVRLFKELDQYRENAGVARLGSLPTIARIGFPMIDRAFPQGTTYSIPALINPEFAKKMGVYIKFKEYGIDQTGWYSNSDSFSQRKKHFEDVSQWNASSTLAAKLSLRYSVWKRDPTNDIRLIRFCLSVPENQYVQNGVDRALIRRATENYLPDKVRLNQRVRGVQGADWVHRMIPQWEIFIAEAQQLSRDKRVLEYLDGQAIKVALQKVELGPRVEFATDPDYKLLMRCLIVYRFLKQFD